MTSIYYYNIHNVLNIQVSRENKLSFRDKINLKFSYFKTPSNRNPDITLNIRPFIPDNSNCYYIDHKYHVKDNYFHVIDREGKAKWQLEIQGYERGPTVINYSGHLSGFTGWFNKDFIPQMMLLHFIEYKLAQKGYFLAHGGGVCKGTKGVLLTGRGGVFKTSLTMDLIRKAGFNFLGDDRVIITENRILSFPIGQFVFDYILNNLPIENQWQKYDYFKLLYKALKRGSYSNNYIQDQAKLEKFIFITRTTGERITCEEITKSHAIKRLIIGNDMEKYIDLSRFGINSGPFSQYLKAYSFVFPKNERSETANKKRRLLDKILSGKQLVEFKIPKQYTPQVFQKLLAIINEKVR